jgi:hypothetical protein
MVSYTIRPSAVGDTHCVGSCVSPRAGLDALEMREISCPFRVANHGVSVGISCRQHSVRMRLVQCASDRRFACDVEGILAYAVSFDTGFELRGSVAGAPISCFSCTVCRPALRHPSIWKNHPVAVHRNP